ncbi:MAG: cellulase family glycosylhydrolase, partial [Anaerolineae bacterium]
MTQSSSTQSSGGDEKGSRKRGPVVLVYVLGIAILLAIAFVGAIVLFRVISGAEPTPTALPTLRSTFTPTATATFETSVPTMPAEATEVTSPVPEQTVEPTQIPETAAPATEPPPTEGPAATEVVPTDTPVPATPRPPSPAPNMTSPDYGVQAFLWWRDELAHRDLGLIRDAGFTWVKQWFAWGDIEGRGKGQYDWSTADRIVDQVEEFGLNLIVRVDHEPEWAGPAPGNIEHFADFLSAMANRYKGRIHAYQVWNEPNLAREWGNKPPNAGEYTQMLKRAYEVIKKADPNAIVVSAGMAPT